MLRLFSLSVESLYSSLVAQFEMEYNSKPWIPTCAAMRHCRERANINRTGPSVGNYDLSGASVFAVNSK